MTGHTHAERAFGAIERARQLMSLNLETANAIFEDAVAYAVALSQAEDIGSVAALQAARPVEAVEKAVGYCSEVYGLSEPKDKVARLIESQFWASASPVGAALEEVAASRGQDPVSSFGPGLAATLAALDHLLRTARRSTEMARLELDLAAESITRPEQPAAALAPAPAPASKQAA